ncbi:MAG: hypothetical protein ACOX5G_08745 [Kiritimatiellia bacterium]|jgi:hypothetical protein
MADGILDIDPNETAAEWLRTKTWTNARGRDDRDRDRAGMDVAAGDGREHAVVLDRDTGAVLGESAGDGHSVTPDWNAAIGRDVCVYHNHPNWDPTLSPDDVLAALRGNVHELGAVTPVDSMRLVAREKNARLADRVREFKRRFDSASGYERLAIADEWRKALKAWDRTGVFKVVRLK